MTQVYLSVDNGFDPARLSIVSFIQGLQGRMVLGPTHHAWVVLERSANFNAVRRSESAATSMR